MMDKAVPYLILFVLPREDYQELLMNRILLDQVFLTRNELMTKKKLF